MILVGGRIRVLTTSVVERLAHGESARHGVEVSRAVVILSVLCSNR